MKISPLNTIPTKFYKSHTNQNISISPSFGAQQDTFEKNLIKEPLEKISIWHEDTLDKLEVYHNPLDKTLIYKKKWNIETQKMEKVPYIADIAFQVNGAVTTFYFIEPDTHKEIGYISINNLQETEKKAPVEYECFKEDGFLRNYHKEGIIGPRVYIEYLTNNLEDKYCGIGKAADQISVEFCKKLGIKPNILSIAKAESIVAHYKRGKRFFTIDKNPMRNDKKFIKKFHTNDPNRVIKERMSKLPSDKKIYTLDLDDLMMYMPREVVRKYEKLAEENPILH